MTCSVATLLCLGILPYFQITLHLKDQANDGLRHAAKFQAMNIDNRLKVLEKDLEIISILTKNHTQENLKKLDDRFSSKLLKEFNSITIFVNPGRSQPLLNRPALQSLRLAPDDINHMSAGNTLLAEVNATRSKSSELLLRLVGVNKPTSGFLVGEINLNFVGNKCHTE